MAFTSKAIALTSKAIAPTTRAIALNLDSDGFEPFTYTHVLGGYDYE
jgi:hypothetical protein